MRRMIIAAIACTAIVGFLAWSPWLTRDRAAALAETQFNQAWAGVMDGCGTQGKNLGVQAVRRVPFGAVVDLDYQCGLVMPGEPALRTRILVTFVGLATGFPHPQ